MPKVSIVLPVYNGEKYMRESINSVLGQTFTDWELIIVDDGSTDDTPWIAEQYAAGDYRIKVIHNKENQKLPKSLNIGFENASGDLFTWTSDDNYYLPDALKKMYEFLCENSNIYMVCADMKMIDSIGNTIGNCITYDKVGIFYYNCVGACFMYRRQVFEQIGGYDEKFFLVEDYDYWLRISRKYGMIGHIEEIQYIYRGHKNSLTETKSKQIKKKLADLRRKNLDWILDNLKNDKIYIWKMYHEFIDANEDMRGLKEKMIAFVPELGIDLAVEDKKKKMIIFGAGDYGGKAADHLKERAAYFVDSNVAKVGTYKKGIKVISTEELFHIYSDYNIVISVSEEKIFEILHFLYINGIRECCTYQQLIGDKM